ncbi:alpha/beta hydrolase [Nocardiopsis sp. RSe5-2]|uniref:Alpha/beta hydrolase n=1 Tax=Nocardiopsis endophytica TaxID=3018445 RepID=A0ABT4U537_9ACTN|nr:alpha/beta hydrolase [Nocardiopsis endophytica]MDA2811452.1 alpha/beta hydrolase [Nocardiopsis endophytica]
MRRGTGRAARAATALAAAVVLTATSTASPASGVPGPPNPSGAWGVQAGEWSPNDLEEAYGANREAAARASRAAERAGDTGRAEALSALAAPDRDLLEFDPRGQGRAVEVVGDLDKADRVVVLVPGADTTLDTFDGHGAKPYMRVGDAARTLHARMAEEDPGARTAVVAWMGYPAPATVSPAVATTGRADTGARSLDAFVPRLLRAAPGASLTLVCHSYGAVVCGRAHEASARAAAAVLVGSPGAGVSGAADIGARRVWAGRGDSDWIAGVPHGSLPLPGTTLGFGPDPVGPGFGAEVFDAGPGGHSDYFAPGSRPLSAVARIALGRAGAGGGNAA